ncbi:glycosyltransferase family 9 protein [Arthrobacter sp. NPDC080031]|uniref:glycosyltransferase family 9 protein n=1 Tax=Arthrobacter sp. NPDC080031 TaxID=3155918 RepID=UPI00345087C7
MNKPGDPPGSTAPGLLILRALGLGDLLVAVPALRALRRHFSAHFLVLATAPWLSPIVKMTGIADRHLPVAGLGPATTTALAEIEPPDVAVNLHGNGQQSRDAVLASKPSRYLGHAVQGPGSGPAFGRSTQAEGAPWMEELHERERWVRMLDWYGIEGDPEDFRLAMPAAHGSAIIPLGASVLHVGAASGSRLWPVDRFAEVARELEGHGHRVALTGGKADQHRARAVARLAGLDDGQILAGRQDLEEFAATLANARLLVSGDTGAAHLASAFATPSAVIFGPAAASRWGPPPSGPHAVLTDATKRRGDPFADSPDPALLAVTVEDVLRALSRLGVA